MKEIKTVTVIGSTGTMGVNVVGIFASFGNTKVYALGRDIDKVKKNIPKMVKSVKADVIAKNIVPADFTMIKQCVMESDLVFESSTENIEVKKSIHNEIAKSLRYDAIACTGTSGLSINELVACYPENLKSNFFGVHMFNPPYSMSLCELIPTKYSDTSLLDELHIYLEKKLYRTVVEVLDSPAFLANRIGFYVINEALQYADKYKDNGGIDYIDAILGQFTGRIMAPITTADFVGLDVHKAIVDNIYNNSNDYVHNAFELPKYVQSLIDNKQLGRKTGAGIYKTEKYDNGTRKLTVWDITTNQYREQIQYRFPFAEEMKTFISEGDYEDAFKVLINNHSQEAELCLAFLLRYIVYSLYTAENLGDSIEAADDVMATGFNWCPPLALYQALSTVADMRILAHEKIPEITILIDVDNLFNKVKPSKYDYRLYFRSK